MTLCDYPGAWGMPEEGSALPGFKTALGLVDDIDAALAPHDTIIAVAPP